MNFYKRKSNTEKDEKIKAQYDLKVGQVERQVDFDKDYVEFAKSQL